MRVSALGTAEEGELLDPSIYWMGMHHSRLVKRDPETGIAVIQDTLLGATSGFETLQG